MTQPTLSGVEMPDAGRWRTFGGDSDKLHVARRVG